jgi:type IV secretory pathway protease TraF
MPPPSRKDEVLAVLPNASIFDLPKWKRGAIGTKADLMKKTGMCSASVCRYLRILHEEGKAHIAHWNQTTGRAAPVWIIGPGEHAEEPDRRPSKEYSRTHRKRITRAIKNAKKGNSFDERYAGQVALALADERAKASRINPVTWLTPLEGIGK